MKKALLIFCFILLCSSVVLAGGSIFKNKRKKSNPDGVYSIGMYICGSLQCPPVRIVEGSCDGIENASLHWGVCLCEEGYIEQNGKCVVDRGVSCNEIGSCNAGYFCNFGGTNTPNQCEKTASQKITYNGVTYYANKKESFSNWCRSTKGTNDCQYGYLTYYAAYDWCSMQGARLLKKEELPTNVNEWLVELPWDGNMSAYWLDDGRIASNGTVQDLGKATGWQGAGGVVCVKDAKEQTMGTSGEPRWLEITDCECNTEKGVSLDPSDELCNIQCCKNKHDDKGFSINAICCQIDDDDCICKANGCRQTSSATPLDNYCCAKAQGLI